MLDERRFSRARVADQADKLAPPDRQAHIVQRHILKRRIRAVDMRHISNF